MNFEQFVEEVKTSIKDHLPEEYRDAVVELYQHEKLNESYLGMTIRKDGQSVAPTLNMNKYYEQYHDFERGEMAFVLEEMADVIQTEPLQVNLGALMNYESAKDKLFIRVSDADRNSEYLEEIPHRQVENLAITYHLAVGISNSGISSAPINNQMLRAYGVTEEQLYQDALENSPKIFPAKVEPIEVMMEKLMREDMKREGLSEEEIDETLHAMGFGGAEPSQNPLTVVTNERETNGAAVLFYPGQMEKLGEFLKGDFYILPSSTHEVLIMPDNGELTCHDLKVMVVDINNAHVPDEDRLADEVYHYDAKDRIFERAETFEKRQKEKNLEKGIHKDANLGQPGQKPKHKSHDMSL